ncbi:MAG: hypothetical protein JWP52_2575 [Rhizobacter sp.]|nr:hypothetical protein [Rhizobacter sp.]
MGIVKISDQMHENLRSGSTALSRSINAQAEHWMRVGMLSELHPGLCYADICQLLLRSTQQDGQALTFYRDTLNAEASAGARRAVRKAAR